MFPNNTQYPDFVPDQLLTSDDLNSLFRFLDEQGRMTRTNLVGVGIVCGFELNPSTDGSKLTVTKGTAVTTLGYLAAFDESEYARYRPYDPKKELTYERFVDEEGEPKLELWELVREAAVEDSVPLTQSFLDGGGDDDEKKVALVFVELSKELDKNCNPESCDDKGQTISVNLRVLLARKRDVLLHGLNQGLGGGYYQPDFLALPKLPSVRFNVPATKLWTTSGIFSAYKSVLTADRIARLRDALRQTWELGKSSYAHEYLTNPFTGLSDAFALLDGAMAPEQLLTLQYVYDHFNDLVAAYDEFRQSVRSCVGLCCPDAALFGRHVLLGCVSEQSHVIPSPLRHLFSAAPVHQCRMEIDRLESLFRRVVLMARSFEVPPVQVVESKFDSFIRLTPSRLGAVTLSNKAMPWYYPAQAPTPRPFYTWWSFEMTAANEADAVHGYHARDYSPRDEVRRPLHYDLEPYDFLRVEGHVGKPVALALATLKQQINSARLPIEVVALATGSDASGTSIADNVTLIALHTQFVTLKTELLCCLRAQARYLATLEIRDVFTNPGKLEQYLSYDKYVHPRDIHVEAQQHIIGEMAVAEAVAVASGGSNAAAETATHKGTTDGGQRIKSSKKRELLRHVEESEIVGIGKQWLGYQEAGDVNLEFMPAPASKRFDRAQLEHWLLVVLDQIEELIVVLEVDELQSMDIESVEARRDVLVRAIEELTGAIDTYLAARVPVAIIKAYIGESRYELAERLGELMPEMTEADAHDLVLTFLNADRKDVDGMLHALQAARGNTKNQRATIQAALAKLDKDALLVPAVKDVIVENDPFFTRLRDRLRALSCLCAVESFRQLREMLAEWINRMRRLNLFGEFVQSHPGVQHKAGVPLGGTLVLVYHRRASNGARALAGGPTDSIGAEVEIPEQGPVDAAVKSAADKLDEGVVVADFYLPYVCCSDQPPIQFQVLENAPPPEEVLLSLQPGPAGTLEYSVGDGQAYAFAPFPAGGALTNAIAELGVFSPSAGNWMFRPSATTARLADQDKLEIDFTYSKGTVESDVLHVVVHNLPRATITNTTPQEVYRVSGEVTLTSAVSRAETLLWLVKAPSGTTNVADVPTLNAYKLNEAGTYTFTLMATQDATLRQAVSNTIVLVVEDDLDKPALELAVNPDTDTQDYSIADTSGYPFSFSPVGGELHGASPDSGVNPNGDGGFEFTPVGAQKQLGQRDAVELSFVYEFEGRRSDTVYATVWAEPRVSITSRHAPGPVPLGTAVIWESEVERADGLLWTITSPTGKVSVVAGKPSLGPLPLNDPGSWMFTLRATQVRTGHSVESEVGTISVLDTGTDEPLAGLRDCGDLGVLVEQFDKLPEVDSAGFDLFDKQVLSSLGVGQLFEELRNVANEPVKRQLEAFAIGKGKKGSWVVRIGEAMDGIMPLLGNTRSKVSKPLLVHSYRLLGQVLLYVNCVSPDDVVAEQRTVLNRLAKHVEGGDVAFEGMKLDVRDMEVVLAWRDDVKRTLTKEQSVKVGTPKTGYVELLTKLAGSF